MSELFGRTDDTRVSRIRALIPPAILLEELVLRTAQAECVAGWRQEIVNIVHKRDDRMLVVVGPCSAHDPKAVLEYARLLAGARQQYSDKLMIVMRCYPEKPRTTIGWKGLINDPHLDGTFKINEGLRIVRRLLLDLVLLEVPAAVEYLDLLTPQWIGDVVSYGAIGARTVESQSHRELASGLSTPVGFKNGTDGDMQIAVDAIIAARSPHCFTSVTKGGMAAIVETTGNDDCHPILRGSKVRTNYDSLAVRTAADALYRARIDVGVMVDCSHGNSNKHHLQQPVVVQRVLDQVSRGSTDIIGVMMESFLVPGRQDVTPGVPLVYGQSITDECMDWPTTESLLGELAESVSKRRKVIAEKKPA